jgi:hypothetical protein
MQDPTATDLSRSVERRIMERTWSGIHRLAVEVTTDHLTVRGHTRSYYLKQLAIQACLEALPAKRRTSLEVDIEVSESAPLLAH